MRCPRLLPAGLDSCFRGAIALLAVALVVAFPSNAAAQASIASLSTDSVVVGDSVQVIGTGFGAKPPRVWLTTNGKTRAKGTVVKLLELTNDGELMVLIKRAREGDYSLMVKPRGKGIAPVMSPATLGVEGPEIVLVDTDEPALPNDEISVLVNNPSGKQEKLLVMGKNAKIVSKATTDEEGVWEFVMRVPTSVPNGTWDVKFTDNVGADLEVGGLAIVGSTKKLGKPVIDAKLDGFKNFKVSNKKVIVGATFSGPTTVLGDTGGNNARRLQLVLPFVVAKDLAPGQYTTAPAMISYVETNKGEPSVELMSADDSFVILVSAVQEGIVAGSFHGELFPMTEGVEPVAVSGTFIYDGTYSADAGDGATSTEIAKDQPAPGVSPQILDVRGTSGATGNYEVGDRVAITYRLLKDDGSGWLLDEMNAGRIALSGPTFNYQRVIAQLSDVITASVDNGDGTYTYTLPPLPATYLPPYNDTPDFDEDDGELQGQDLLDGTYTVGMWFEWSYSVEGDSHKEVGTTLYDILVGASVKQLVPRAVTSSDNCNACHGVLQFHGGGRRTTELCVLCHTAGAEDRNTTPDDAPDGTPGVTIEWSVMVHKLHNGAYLPSVLGVTTDSDGKRVYDAEPVPYQMIGYKDHVVDYSDTHLPAWPHVNEPMPRDAGYELMLTEEQQDLEDTMRSANTNCVLCHGDPDGDGPIEKPAQGDFAYSVMRRNTCGSCHDDWVHELPYRANTSTMPGQTSDATCTLCHPTEGSSLATIDGHLHPLLDETFAEGLVFDVQSVTADGEGTANIGPGDKLAISMFLRDAMGNEIEPDSLDDIRLALAGPTDRMNLLLGYQVIPAEALTGSQPYTFRPPMRVHFEILGTATAEDDVFAATYTPMWDMSAHATQLWQRTGSEGGDSVLSADVLPPINFVDVDDPSGFERDDFVVIDDGEDGEEYLQIQNVIDNRLWFASPVTTSYAPGPLVAHDMGASVRGVTLDELDQGDDFSLELSTSTVTEVAAWMDDAVIISTYSSDFIVPESYGLTYNAGPDLTERDGLWTGKQLVDGTYTLAIWGEKERTLELFGETNDYLEGAPGVKHDFLLGDATTIEPWDKIASIANCASCHVDIQFHGGHRRGLESCISCHGVAGAADRPQYVATSASATDGVTIAFREMVHKIHSGADLAKGDEYVVNGYGYDPNGVNNVREHMYDHVVYPRMPDGVFDCASCHGEDNGSSWILPRDTRHPSEAVLPPREWAVVCGACHDDDTSVAHIESMSSPVSGAESCLVCHDQGMPQAVDKMHVRR
ncbi:MAG: hypothetical protein DRQ55_03110 [Planctomycetota bacterium]|nr:MAG: hypothetical protein DRQ55_03110 [Planctomycetota bacterium]